MKYFKQGMVKNEIRNFKRKLKIKVLLRRGYNAKRLWEGWGEDYLYEDGRTKREQQHNFIIKKLNDIKPESILEVGCGFGRNLKIIDEEGLCFKYIIGVDISKSMLEKANKYLNNMGIGLICADASKLPFANKCFDMIFTYGCLMHVPPSEIKFVLQELIRITKNYIINIEESFGDRGCPKNGILRINDYTFAYDYITLYKDLGIEIWQNDEKNNLYSILVRI
jgi:SAM-dependent methyltransferase